MHKEMLEKDEQVSLLETKLAMHKEMLEKDGQVSLLETKLALKLKDPSLRVPSQTDPSSRTYHRNSIH